MLLQDTDDDALHVARRVTNDATEMARWFLARDRDSAAIEALEYGRGMVLHAATSGARLAEALDGGHVELAAEWAAHTSGGEADDDLRYRAMPAIEGSPAEARLLAPPTLGEITAALRAATRTRSFTCCPTATTGPVSRYWSTSAVTSGRCSCRACGRA